MKLTRLAVAIAVGASLVSAGAAGAAAKPKIAACTSFADALADTALDGVVPVTDPATDITKVAYTYKDKVFTAKVDVTKYADASAYSNGIRFDVNFTVDGKVVTLFAQKARTEAAASMVFAFQGIKIDNVYKSGSNKLVTQAVSGNTFSISASASDIEAALGSKIVGKKVNDLNAISWGQYEALSAQYDTAAGDSKTFTVATCK